MQKTRVVVVADLTNIEVLLSLGPRGKFLRVFMISEVIMMLCFVMLLLRIMGNVVLPLG